MHPIPRRIRVGQASFVAPDLEYKLRTTKIKKEVYGFDYKYDLFATNKVSMEEVRAMLDTKLDSLVQANEELIIQNESQERVVVDYDRLVEEIRDEMEALRKDCDWLW